jgi:hypothetical protein
MDPIRASRSAAAGTPPVTAHARARMQQRGIRSDVLGALLAFGSERHLGGQRCDIAFFDKKARKRLAKGNPDAVREAEKFIRTYAILGADGAVVTVGHRFRRVRES